LPHICLQKPKCMCRGSKPSSCSVKARSWKSFPRRKRESGLNYLELKIGKEVLFVIASGTSEPHLRAIARDLTDTLWDKYKLRPRRVEGAAGATWQVLDFFDVIVHIMRSDAREKYKLESLWGDAPQAGKGRAKKRVATKRVAAKKTVARAKK